ncbi:NADP-dependent oxidoreductase domain-containing protein [Mycena maculata]|uniref:NADP-dependent oxidoreductase domain-containing protein n=1 Tax=Mycena maculata TaxID=230809 RepID=A0AAD7IA88_9AGAR|nr:NADP-dependent oxidoreductase domain-containing protein [Mycena maculata]
MSPTPTPTRRIGNSLFPAIGFGAMGISTFYGPILDAAYAAGCTTADLYGDSKVLLGKWFKCTGRRVEIFLCTKFGFLPDLTVNGSPARVKEAAEASLAKLGVEIIDL